MILCGGDYGSMGCRVFKWGYKIRKKKSKKQQKRKLLNLKIGVIGGVKKCQNSIFKVNLLRQKTSESSSFLNKKY